MCTLFKKMAGILLLAICVCIPGITEAQPLQCGAIGHPSENPNAIDLESKLAEIYSSANYSKRMGGPAVIPVVVHIVHRLAIENISDAQVLSQMEILNEDFRRLNADTINTRSIFLPIAADAEINFCLATVDPAGFPTTGITRNSTVKTSFSISEVKKTITGGIDAWPTDQYLNIWVCNLAGGILGAGTIPTTVPPNEDGIVMWYKAFGDTGTVIAPYNLGRPTTHEAGHWLGLYHLGSNDCVDPDYVADTPVDSIDIPVCDSMLNTCIDTPVDMPDMIENFMALTEDACMNLFTEGQKARMWDVLLAERFSLLSSGGCGGVAITPTAELSHLTVFPNPSYNLFSVSLKGLPFSRAILRFADGKMIREWDIENGEFTIDLHGEPAGIYFLEIHSGSKFLIQKLVFLP